MKPIRGSELDAVTRSLGTTGKPDAEPADPEVAALARDVVGYLEANPEAADTMEHIARWWILRQRIEAALAKTQQALDYLEARGIVERTAEGLYRLLRQPERPR